MEHGVGESELSDWLIVFSELLPTFEVFVHTYSVLLLGRENVALRGEVELGGSEKAVRLHIEMWVRAQGSQANNWVRG